MIHTPVVLRDGSGTLRATPEARRSGERKIVQDISLAQGRIFVVQGAVGVAAYHTLIV